MVDIRGAWGEVREGASGDEEMVKFGAFVVEVTRIDGGVGVEVGDDRGEGEFGSKAVIKVVCVMWCRLAGAVEVAGGEDDSTRVRLEDFVLDMVVEVSVEAISVGSVPVVVCVGIDVEEDVCVVWCCCDCMDLDAPIMERGGGGEPCSDDIGVGEEGNCMLLDVGCEVV